MAVIDEWVNLVVRVPASKKKELEELVRASGQSNVSEAARRGIYREMEEMKKGKEAA